jgi:hypothetical protein
MKRSLSLLTVAVALAAPTAGCGNYSNADLDFQLSLPEQHDLDAHMPQALVVPADTPEYYKVTRGVVAIFNGAVDAFTALVDYVRAQPPTERSVGRRVWGPFPNGDSPTWLNRVVMLRVADTTDPLGYRIEYSVDYRRADASDDTWQPLLTGMLFPTGGASHGRGHARLDYTTARPAGYPLRDNDPKNKLLVLEIDYNRSALPITIDLSYQNTPDSATPGGTYHYFENADASGGMVFQWRDDTNIWAQALEIRSRWEGSGAGRADARVTEGLAATFSNVAIVDCWGPDASATYVLRILGMQRREEGSATACVFGPP